MEQDKRITMAPAAPSYGTAGVGGLSSAATSGGDSVVLGGAGMPGSNTLALPDTGPAAAHPAPPSVATVTRPAGPDLATLWPDWAVPQLRLAVGIAGRAARRPDATEHSIARELRRRWYAPALTSGERLRGPLGGTYRRAHAGSGAPINVDGISIVDRHDVIGRDGWWRTWSDSWSPLGGREQSVRLRFTPRTDAIGDFVSTLTCGLMGTDVPWLLACPTDPRRLRRPGSVMLYVPSADAISAELALNLRPTIRPAVPPLCRPVATGIVLADDTTASTSFGRERCALIARAVHGRALRCERSVLHAIATEFLAHGLDPAAPHRSPR